MQPNAQQVHDDLASLFSRNLTFNPELRAAAAKDSPRQEPAPPAQSPPIVYSISQHYHHMLRDQSPRSQQRSKSRSNRAHRQRWLNVHRQSPHRARRLRLKPSSATLA